MNYSNDSIIKDNNENIIIIIIIIIIVVVVVVVVVLMTEFDSLGVIWWSIKSEKKNCDIEKNLTFQKSDLTKSSVCLLI